jgi:hypothetical protein
MINLTSIYPDNIHTASLINDFPFVHIPLRGADNSFLFGRRDFEQRVAARAAAGGFDFHEDEGPVGRYGHYVYFAAFRPVVSGLDRVPARQQVFGGRVFSDIAFLARVHARFISSASACPIRLFPARV